MVNEVIEILQKTDKEMQKVLNSTQDKVSNIRTGKAMPNMLDAIKVDCYNTLMPINQIANISSPDARTLLIQAFDKNLIANIEKAILNADLGFNPQNDGQFIRINVPPLTQERRQEFIKILNQEIEMGRVAIRNKRKDGNTAIKNLKEQGVSIDNIKDGETEMMNKTKHFTSLLDNLGAEKEKNLLSI